MFKYNPASFRLDIATSASHPEDRSEEYLDQLHSYVRYTKASQMHEDIFIKMLTRTMPAASETGSEGFSESGSEGSSEAGSEAASESGSDGGMSDIPPDTNDGPSGASTRFI